MEELTIPLADVADLWLAELDIPAIDGATLLGERATLAGLRVPGRVSAGGGCRLYETRGASVALNLARPDDRASLPALFEVDAAGVDDVTALAAASDGEVLVARGAAMGLPIAHEVECAPPAIAVLAEGPPSPPPQRRPHVVDLSALWAGPLAAHLLGLKGATVVKVESMTRPDAMRDGRDAGLFALLDGGKANVTLDFAADRAALMALIASADIVIEAARPRALAQLGIDADAIVAATPGLVWISITGHGVPDRIGFGDDAAVAGGLAAAMRTATGRPGFVGDAIADPLTGIRAAGEAWRRWREGRGGRIGVAMSGVVAQSLAEARVRDGAAFDASLCRWAAAEGERFPAVRRRAPC